MSLATEHFGSVARMCQRLQEENGYLVVALDREVAIGSIWVMNEDCVPDLDGMPVRIIKAAEEQEYVIQCRQLEMGDPWPAPDHIRFYRVVAE